MGNVITVDFRDDTLFAVERDDGVFVAVKPICDVLGLNWSAQYRRITRDAILSEAIAMMATPFGRHGQEEVCLKLELLNGWFFSIDENRTKDDVIRQKVLAYKRECYQVLFEHFHGKAKALPEGAESEESEGLRLRMVNETRQIFGVQAAGELWFKLGLPMVASMVKEAERRDLFSYAAVKTVENGEQNAA